MKKPWSAQVKEPAIVDPGATGGDIFREYWENRGTPVLGQQKAVYVYKVTQTYSWFCSLQYWLGKG
jgi:hypothetical protein